MILESVTLAKTSVTIHVVNFSLCRTINFGSHPENDVIIIDASVDAMHGQFKIFNVYCDMKKTMKGVLSIGDNKSKYGTLALIRRPFPLYDFEHCAV